MDSILDVIGRTSELFAADLASHEADLSRLVRASRFLVIGGAGSIGQAVTREIFRRDPKLLHVVDISENNMVELVRDLRSSIGYSSGELPPSPSTQGAGFSMPLSRMVQATIMCSIFPR